VLRGSRGDAAGTESGSSFIERITVNTGTVLVSPLFGSCVLGRMLEPTTSISSSTTTRICGSYLCFVISYDRKLNYVSDTNC
jgi:hypothetical protein